MKGPLKKGPIALIGARGQLGQDLQALLSKESLHAFSRLDLDVLDFARVREVLSHLSPVLVINTSFYNRVDDCEREMERAFSVNAFAVRHLAEVCRDLGCPLVHFSTDYVFDGLKGTPYLEEDPPGPLNVYGASKLLGESWIRVTWEWHFIVRTSALFGISGSRGKGGNFVETMIRLAKEKRPIRVVQDQVTSPTFTGDLATAVVKLIEEAPFGTYHLTPGARRPGSISPGPFSNPKASHRTSLPSRAGTSGPRLAVPPPRSWRTGGGRSLAFNLFPHGRWA